MYFDLIITLFPNHRFWLIDPAPFGWKNLDRVVYSQSFFTDKTAQQFHNQFRGDVLFMSDIRLGGGSFEEFESNVDKNNQQQARWIKLMEARAASLKFRIPFTAKKYYPYLAGRIRLQAWAPKSSTESRLEVTRKNETYPVQDYSSKEYEQKFMYHNLVERDWAYYDLGPGISIGEVKGMDHCNDCAREAGIWRAYLSSEFAAESPFKTIAALMNAATQTTSQNLNRFPHGVDPNEYMPAKRLKIIPHDIINHVPETEIGVCKCAEPAPPKK